MRTSARVHPLSRLPLWVLHTETGALGSAVRELAATLPLPAYGLAMGADAQSCESLAELAARYLDAVQAVQPAGPYLLLGCSMAGAALANAMCVALEARGQHAALLLLDGCLGQPANLPLHDPTW